MGAYESSVKCPRCGKVQEEEGRYCPLCGYDVSLVKRVTKTGPQSWIGKVIDKRYRVLKVIGEGGMGVVYQVSHVVMEKVMAMKVLRPELIKNERQVQRFQKEIRVLSKLSNIHTISVFDCGETDDGSLFIVMEYLQGYDLEWLLQKEKFLPPRRAASIARQVCSSLKEAHSEGIIHRDIKPANIFLVHTGEKKDFVKVLDFGIAKLAHDKRIEERLTEHNIIVGTPYYMAPEQASGSRELTPAVDIYSLGVVLYEMVVGRPPFDGEVLEILNAHIMSEPLPPSEAVSDRYIDPALEEIILKALRKNPNERFSSIGEMGEALEAYLESSPQGQNIFVLPSEKKKESLSLEELSETIPTKAVEEVPGEVKTELLEDVHLEVQETSPKNSDEYSSYRGFGGSSDGGGEVILLEERGKLSGEGASGGVGGGDYVAYPPREELLPEELIAGKDDFVSLERAWRIRYILRSIFASLIFLAFIGGVAWLFFPSIQNYISGQLEDREKIDRLYLEEREPNNNILQATPIPIDAKITGQLGLKLGPTSSDRDWFKFSLSSETVLVITLAPPRTVDVELGLYRLLEQREGVRKIYRPVEIRSVNNRLRGGVEKLLYYRFKPGSYYILVRELILPDEEPQENQGNYTIEIKSYSAEQLAGVEVEPDDNLGNANQLKSYELFRAYQNFHRDVDFFELPDEKFRYFEVCVLKFDRNLSVEFKVLKADGSLVRFRHRRLSHCHLHGRGKAFLSLKKKLKSLRKKIRSVHLLRFRAQGAKYLKLKMRGNAQLPADYLLAVGGR